MASISSILILHHLEPMWEKQYRQRNTCFDLLQEKAIEFIENAKIGNVIVTRFEDWQLKNDYLPCFAEKVNNVYDYGYGWEIGQFDKLPGIEWCEGGNHSQIVLIQQWMKDIKKHQKKTKCNVFIGGAFDGECLEDLEIALRHLEIKFNRVEELIV